MGWIARSKGAFSITISYWDICLRKLKLQFSRIPLFGPLVECKKEDHWAAFTETFLNGVFSTLPFWLAAIVGYLYQLPKNVKDHFINPEIFQALLEDSVKNGELFIFSTSILAPIMFLTWLDLKGTRTIPAKLSLGTVALLTMLLCTGLFSALKANPSVNENFILYLSGWLAFVAIIITYIGTVYHKYRQGSPELLKDDEKNFVDQLMGHR